LSVDRCAPNYIQWRGTVAAPNGAAGPQEGITGTVNSSESYLIRIDKLRTQQAGVSATH